MPFGTIHFQIFGTCPDWSGFFIFKLLNDLFVVGLAGLPNDLYALVEQLLHAGEEGLVDGACTEAAADDEQGGALERESDTILLLQVGDGLLFAAVD